MHLQALCRVCIEALGVCDLFCLFHEGQVSKEGNRLSFSFYQAE